MTEIVLASDNVKKLKELKAILGDNDFKLITKTEAGYFEEVEENFEITMKIYSNE